MHCILGLEVWQGASEVFLGQGKYTMEISKEILDARLQTLDHSYGAKYEVIC
jgi:hypothetical protein